MNKLTPPSSEQELLARAYQIAGLRLADVALTYNQKLPPSLTQSKGFIGQLIELALGAFAQNLPEPDFPNLGIELKTIPLNSNGSPRESTYICTAPLSIDAVTESWETSRVRNKLKHILWVPIQADPTIPLSERRIGTAVLWQPDSDTESILKQDWEELTQILHMGNISMLSAKVGTYLQVRPKAAHSRILSHSIDANGEPMMINPKGFYLRTILTQKILEKCYCKI